MDSPETYSDQIVSFAVTERNVRGRIVRLSAVVDDVLSAHDYPAPITHLLAEALVLSALIGSLTKVESGQMTMQAQTDGGIVSLLVSDYRDGQLRGYAQFDHERLASLGANPSLYAMFGKGYLAITFDQDGGKGRYQGVVPLEGESLADACQAYFAQSEQVPTLIRTAIRSQGSSCEAAGLLVQHLPEGEVGRERLHVRHDHPDWEHVAILAGTTRHEELLDDQLSMEAILWRLFHEEDEVRVHAGPELSRGCRCTRQHFETVLANFPDDERAEMQNEDGLILVDCAFCSKVFPIDPGLEQ